MESYGMSFYGSIFPKFTYLSVCMSASQSVQLYSCLSVHLSLHLSLCLLPSCLSLCLNSNRTYRSPVLFNFGLFWAVTVERVWFNFRVVVRLKFPWSPLLSSPPFSSTLLYSTLLYYTILYFTLFYFTLLCSTLLYFILLYFYFMNKNGTSLDL